MLGVVMDIFLQRTCRAFIEHCSLSAVHRCMPLTVTCAGLINEDSSFLRCSIK